jgi:MFS transporter, PPP family, 3-phenylpropionic acid transporter
LRRISDANGTPPSRLHLSLWEAEGSPEMANWPDVRARRGLIPFFVLFSTLYMSFGVVSPFLPVMVERRGLAPTEIGLILALSTAARLAAGPAAGRIADALGALRAVFAFCALAAAVTALAFLGRGSWAETLFVSVLYAALLAPLTMIADALALEAAAPDAAGRGFEYGWVRGCGSAAFIVGSVLAGHAIVAVGFDAVIWGGSTFLVAAAAAVMFVAAPRMPASGSTAERSTLWGCCGPRNLDWC